MVNVKISQNALVEPSVNTLTDLLFVLANCKTLATVILTWNFVVNIVILSRHIFTQTKDSHSYKTHDSFTFGSMIYYVTVLHARGCLHTVDQILREFYMHERFTFG